VDGTGTGHLGQQAPTRAKGQIPARAATGLVAAGDPSRQVGRHPAIVEMAELSVANDPIPVRNDREAMAGMARTLIGNPAHFAWVAEQRRGSHGRSGAMGDAGILVPRAASVGADVLRNDSGKRGLGCCASTASGSRPQRIKAASFEFEPNADPRLVEFVRKLGFTRQSTNLALVVRGSHA